MKINNFLLMLFLTCLLCNCASSAPTHYYILNAPAPEIAGSAEVKKSASLAPVTVPKYLDRKPIITRRTENELVISDLNLWAEPLEESIHRVTSEILSQNGIRLIPWVSKDLPAITEIEISIKKFERTEGGGVTLEATYNIIPKRASNFETRTYSSETACSGASYNDTVSCMNSALYKLADTISQTL